MDKIALKNKIRGLEGLTNDEKSALIELLYCYRGIMEGWLPDLFLIPERQVQ
jgi:hypothetical protein